MPLLDYKTVVDYLHGVEGGDKITPCEYAHRVNAQRDAVLDSYKTALDLLHKTRIELERVKLSVNIGTLNILAEMPFNPTMEDK